MRKKDILELKRRFKKDDCTFTKMCGCYVNGEKNIILNISETFLNIEEEEFFKYLEIAKKVLSGTIGNNLLELEFPLSQEEIGGMQYSLMELKKSKLKDPVLLEKFYQKIIDTYDYSGNFLILIFHDVYDILTKTTDNSKLDESEEVYEYLLCAICPVSLSKPALGYLKNDNRIGARVRDWVVENPNLGFVFPAFIDRSSDVNSIMYYTKNAKDPHPELMEEVLGCTSKKTATEQKEVFTTIIKNAMDSDSDCDDKKSDDFFVEIQENLSSMIDEHITVNDKDSEPIILTSDAVSNLLSESGLSQEISGKIEKCYEEEFGDTPPLADYLVDKKVLAANEQRKKEKRLQDKVQILEKRLEETIKETAIEDNVEASIGDNDGNDINDATENDIDSYVKNIMENDSENNMESNIEDNKKDVSSENYDIVLHVKPQKVSQIKSEIINGKKCLIIPVDDDEQTTVNGDL